jgi:hypothetical protein
MTDRAATTIGTSKLGNSSGEFGMPTPPIANTTRAANTAASDTAGWNFGVPKPPQADITQASSITRFAPNSSATLGRTNLFDGTPSVQSSPQPTPPSQPPPPGFSFNPSAFQTPAPTTPSSSFQFGGGVFQVSPPNNPTQSWTQQPLGPFGGPTVSSTPTDLTNAGGASSPNSFGGSPFGNPLNNARGENLFAVQNSATAGGMARRFATAKGPKGTRKR